MLFKMWSIQQIVAVFNTKVIEGASWPRLPEWPCILVDWLHY